MTEVWKDIRKNWRIGDAKRDAGLTTPENVVRFDSLRYGDTPGMNLLDVYRPKNAKGKLPVIVSIHGGGWVYGDKELYQFYGMTLAQRGFAVINFTYRLAPEWKFPAPLEDTNAVISWMYEQQEAYGLDMSNVFMVGDSAGGNLCALYSEICTDPDYAEKFDFTVPNSFRPKAVALNCGAYVPIAETAEEQITEQDNDLMKLYLPKGGTREEAWMVDATKHVTADFPPTFLMTCFGDFCKPQAPLLEKVLTEKKIPLISKVYGKEEQPLYHVFHLTIQDEEGQKCNDEECDFFRNYISD